MICAPMMWENLINQSLIQPLLANASANCGGLGTYAWAFGQGVLVDLTPCVYPLIPVTVAVFGAQGVSKGRALFLASAYVLGMATLYTSLGIGVALAADRAVLHLDGSDVARVVEHHGYRLRGPGAVLRRQGRA